jgi:AraC family transcriptional regulator
MTPQPISESECGELNRLLATATAALDTDSGTARAYLLQARALLRTPEVASRGGLAPSQVRRLGEYIQAHLGDPMSISDLAEVAGLSASHFSRAFRQTFGLAPMRYVSIQRVQRAKELIMTARCSLADVGLACGLCDQAHLSRLFRRVVGASPSFWRREFGAAVSQRSPTAAA